VPYRSTGAAAWPSGELSARVPDATGPTFRSRPEVSHVDLRTRLPGRTVPHVTRTTAPRAVTAGVAGVLTFALVLPAGGAVAAPSAPSGPTTTGTAEATHVPAGADQDPEPVAPESSEAEFVESDDAAGDEVPAHEHEHSESEGSAAPSAEPDSEATTEPSGEPSGAPSAESESEAAPDESSTPDTAPGGEEVLVADAAVTGFGVVGVTWSGDLTDEHALIVHVRTTERPDPAADDPSWSDWEEIAVEPSPRGRLDGTEPVVVGDVAHVQARVSGEDAADIRGLELTVIDPGTSSADDDVPVPPEETSPSGSAVAAMPVASRPGIASRADWGADESIMTWTPRQGDVRGAAIHHTAGTNGYSRSDVPRIIRGIYAYHAQTRDWGDIGYNFLVDRYGRIWEGRAGGVTRQTTGGHAIGVNATSTGISMIGNYDAVRPTTASISAVVRLVAWKLSLHDVPATGQVTLDGTRLNRVFGHRDVSSTACPGRYLYPKLGEIRRRAQAAQDRAAAEQAQKGIPDGTFVQNPNGNLAMVENGRKHIAYCSVVQEYGASCGRATKVSRWQWRAFKPGGRLQRTAMLTDGRVFRIDRGKKREAFDVLSLEKAGKLTKKVTLAPSAVRTLPYGNPFVRAGVVVVNRTNGNHRLVTAGNKHGYINKYLLRRTPLGDLDTGYLDGSSVSRMPKVAKTSGVVSRRNGRDFLMTRQGLLRVDRSGDLRGGTTTQHWSKALMKQFDRLGHPNPVVVRVRKQSQWYVLRDGVLRPVSKARARQLNGGNNPDVQVILKVTKRQFPVGSRL